MNIKRVKQKYTTIFIELYNLFIYKNMDEIG